MINKIFSHLQRVAERKGYEALIKEDNSDAHTSHVVSYRNCKDHTILPLTTEIHKTGYCATISDCCLAVPGTMYTNDMNILRNNLVDGIKHALSIMDDELTLHYEIPFFFTVRKDGDVRKNDTYENACKWTKKIFEIASANEMATPKKYLEKPKPYQSYLVNEHHHRILFESEVCDFIKRCKLDLH